MQIKSSLLISGLWLASSGAAFAQATSPAGNCTPTETRPQQGTLSPNGTTTGKNAEPLSDQLAKSGGVLCPPGGVDTEMHVPTPDGGTNTPVIPPPGSPGGDRSVRPE
ncbi:hypothetical protein [Tardiphaga sp.]|uniref:hypothetical protein n=1 Tax=Tardiphaga sp. TaxID=1926292 RepID=UPI0026091AF6|nr:hypothetical protein [Tardiphaga sp.]MDB5618122.1 hypothetical protein [Tardiphaga sp.]